ncbi:hypothetical protein AcW1_010003 [Taiwanofungus camphoratus]|nr:hypothetical protein AcW1_010003 [Antrodia cinnamomea]
MAEVGLSKLLYSLTFCAGWIFGTLDMDDYSLRILCVDLQICIVNVEYRRVVAHLFSQPKSITGVNLCRLAPEHSFPTGLNDCYAALKWTSNNQRLLSGSSSIGFLLGGQSAGSNLAAVIARRARDDPFFAKHRITGHILQIPVVLHADAYPEEYKSELLSLSKIRTPHPLIASNCTIPIV